MKKNVFMISLMCLMLFVSCFDCLAAELFNITHETGDLSEYDGSDTDGGDLSVETDAGLAGTTYGMQCVIDDTNQLNAYKENAWPASNEMRVRFYFDTNGIGATMVNNDEITMFHDYDAAWADKTTIIFLAKYGGAFQLVGEWYDDGGYLDNFSVALTDGEHYVEIHWERATGAASNDGRYRAWLDGGLIDTEAGVDNFDELATMFNYEFGAFDIGQTPTGTIYLDEIKANDDGSEIGPAVINITFKGSTISGMSIE